MTSIPYQLVRHWLLSTLVVLCAIVSYTKMPLYGADPTPTPNVSTVPKPEQVLTPTPAPVIVIITQAPPTPTANSSGDTPSNTSEDEASASPNSTAPGTNPSTGNVDLPATSAPAPGVLTGVIVADQVNIRQAPTTAAPIIDTLAANAQVTIFGRTVAADWFYLCCGNQQRQGWVSAPSVQVVGGDHHALPVMTTEGGMAAPSGPPALALTVATTPPLIWQGAIIQVALTVRNTGALTLTNLALRQELPSALRYQTSASTSGTFRLEPTAAGGAQMVLEWAQLAPAAQVTAVVTVQVQPTTPNGLLLDSRAAVQSAEGATATATLTLAMPPAELPHFRK